MADKHKNPTEIRLAAPLEFAAPEGDALPAKFSGTAYSGGKVSSYGCVIDMDSTSFAQKMPLLFEHMRSSIVGVIDKADSKGFKLSVSGKLFSDMPGSDAEQIAQLSKRGAPYQMSVGLFGYREEFVPSGNTVKVNGQEFSGPIYVLRGGTVREVSICTLGADANTDAQFFSHPDANKGSKENTVDEQQAKELTEANKKLAEQLEAATKKLNEQAEANAAALKAARNAAIDALFAETKQKPTDAQRAAYLEMSEAAFSVAAADRRALVADARKRDSALFTDTATGDTDTTQGDGKPKPKEVKLSASDIFAKRAKQASEVRF